MATDGPLRQAAREAFVYALPMVEIAAIRARMMAGGTKPGQFAARLSLATPQTRAVTTPNNDTINAQAFIDLSHGEARLTLPPLGGRYASLALMDMFSNNFAVLGTRTTGGDGGNFRLVGPAAPAPDNAIRAPTPWVWAVARVLVAGPEDLAAARVVLAGFTIASPPAGSPAPGASRDAPWTAYLKAVSELLRENPPPATDRAILERMAPLGLGSAGFDPARFDAAASSEIAAGIDEARAAVRSPMLASKIERGKIERGKIERGWAYQPANIGVFRQDYETRARVALGGLAALPQVEAMYLAALNPDGRRRFTGDGVWRLTFAKDLTPPVDAFWSLTLYEATPAGQFFLTRNPIDRYSVGDRTRGLARNPDGSLDLWISRTDPGGVRSANWLPAPATGPFAMILRAYLPKPAMQSHAYVPPPIVRG